MTRRDKRVTRFHCVRAVLAAANCDRFQLAMQTRCPEDLKSSGLPVEDRNPSVRVSLTFGCLICLCHEVVQEDVPDGKGRVLYPGGDIVNTKFKAGAQDMEGLDGQAAQPGCYREACKNLCGKSGILGAWQSPRHVFAFKAVSDLCRCIAMMRPVLWPGFRERTNNVWAVCLSAHAVCSAFAQKPARGRTIAIHRTCICYRCVCMSVCVCAFRSERGAWRR
jgi:hypothetical protein